MRSGAEPAPFGFTGELHHDDLVYLRARWYDPASGTFLGRDPFAGFERLPYSLHPYQYAYAAPTMWTDPSGLCLDAQGNPCLQPGASPDPAWEPFAPRPVAPTPAVPYSPDGYWVAPLPATPTPYPLTGYRDPVDSATMLDGLQTTLDLAGLAPVFGIFPDGLNACISLLRGDDTGFVLSSGAMIPVIGMAGTAAKYSDEAAAIARWEDEGGALASEAYEAFIEAHNRLTRNWYNAQVGQIDGLNKQWIEQGISLRERAYRAWEVRHSARLRAREMMRDPGQVVELMRRDIKKYQNSDGPTFEQRIQELQERGLSGDDIYEAIIEGSQRTDSTTNRRYQ